MDPLKIVYLGRICGEVFDYSIVLVYNLADAPKRSNTKLASALRADTEYERCLGLLIAVRL